MATALDAAGDYERGERHLPQVFVPAPQLVDLAGVGAGQTDSVEMVVSVVAQPHLGSAVAVAGLSDGESVRW